MEKKHYWGIVPKGSIIKDHTGKVVVFDWQEDFTAQGRIWTKFEAELDDASVAGCLFFGGQVFDNSTDFLRAIWQD